VVFAVVFAVVFNTANAPAERGLAVFGDPPDTLWENRVFGLCGVEDVHRRRFGVTWLGGGGRRHAQTLPAPGARGRNHADPARGGRPGAWL